MFVHFSMHVLCHCKWEGKVASKFHENNIFYNVFVDILSGGL